MADIIVTDVTPRIQYTAGGGSPTVFSYPFPIFEDTDLNVYLTPVGSTPDDVVDILVYNVDYTVTNSSPPTVGGIITLTTGATSGDVITIVRNQPDNRLNNYIDGGLFEATDVNTDFDRTVFMAQQNKMYDQTLGIHYNVCAQPVTVVDNVLPVLGANEVWVKNNANNAITTFNIAGGGGGGVVNSVSGTSNRITATPTTGNVVVNISASYVGQTSITTLGTIATGTWNATTIGTIYGGTGLTSYTLGDTLYASGVNTLAKLSGNTTSGIQYLSQTGTGAVSAAPVWASISGGDITGAALTKVDDTNVTLTLGGTPATALLRAASITAGWTGQLSLARGGTNANLTASNGGIFYSTATAGAILSGTATARQMLQSGASTTPAWSTATWPATTTVSQLLYSSSANVVAGLSTANSAALVTTSAGVPVMSSTMTNGQVIIGSTGATPTAATLTAGANVTITNGAGTITIAASSGSGGAGRLLAVTAFTASGTWTANVSTASAIIEVVGGGGGGAGSSVATNSGAGGGGGGYSRLYTSSQGASQTVTIGAGGTAGTNAPGNGGTGGTSSFGALVSATGGAGGNASGATSFGQGGAGGVGSSGTFNSTGGPGIAGVYITGLSSTSGAGGNSVLGGGAIGVTSATAGNTGGNYGGGGSGAGGVGANVGGAGAGGIVIVYEYS